jgi:hypothetical protein
MWSVSIDHAQGLVNNHRSDRCAVIASAARQSSPSAATPSHKLAQLDTKFWQHRDVALLDCLAFGSQ